ncbi:ribonuclease J [Phaeovibrio sulfidiphilus]|uniref:Ribonuclease J n=1 Tax=Phaeovibrio sulfidiphilus TaxID=1220600 RepID=A0A8J6YPX5_9PROT|nr:ribonuclease J [Phaeovibrio sulfidiphilus]MBE1237072.1 ribonuclease J [Phaeovibrio sulfidiphilus]
MSRGETQTEIRVPRFEKDGLYCVPLGGAGEIGMNATLYGTAGRWLLVDLGLMFGNERTSPGVDLILPDTTFIEERREALEGIVITHVHEDHIGAVPYLIADLECPVYASPFTAAFLRRKLQDEGVMDEVTIIEVPQNEAFRVGPFELELVSTTHSTPEASHLVVRTSRGTVFHTADWKNDPEPLVGPPVDEDRLREIGDEGVLALVGDSTNIFNKEPTGSEGEVRRSLIELFGRLDKRILVGCFASNIARVESIAIAARENGREVALVGRSLWRMVETARSVGYLKDAPRFLTDEESAQLPRNRVVHICTGSQGEPRAALRRIAMDAHPWVRLDSGDTVLFSSRVIPGNERAVLDVQNELARKGVSLITAQDALIHVSGHPGAREVRALYEALRPQIVLPVHGEPMHLNEHAAEAHALGARHVLEAFDGDVARLDVSPPSVVGRVFSGRLALDGERLIPLESELLRDRRKMAFSGSLVVSLLLDRKGHLRGEPAVSARGLLDPRDDDEDMDDLYQEIARIVAHAKPAERQDDRLMAETVRIGVRRFFRILQNRKPMVDVHVFRA